MTGYDVLVVVASGCAAVATVATVIVGVGLSRRTRELSQLIDELRRETLPLVRDACVVVDQAATEMVRVGDVLGSAEAVSSTVDSASRLAYRAFSNPLVRVLAFGTGVQAALRRLFGRPVPETRIAAVSAFPRALPNGTAPSRRPARSTRAARRHGRSGAPQ